MRMIADLIHTGGSGAMLALVYVGYTVARKAEAAHETLKRIEQRMIDDRETLKLSVAETDIKLDAIHADLQSMPLQMARQRRIIE